MTNAQRRGRFVVLEGVDGCGSTTAARVLAEELRAGGREVVLTCEPSGGPVGSLVRAALEKRLTGEAGEPRRLSGDTLALLFAADRLDHVHSVVLPALERGAIVVCDRYVLSSLAYQSASSPEGDALVPWLRSLNGRAVPADLTLILDVSADTAARRRAARGGPEELFETVELQRRLVELYSRAEQLLDGGAVVHVDAELEPAQVVAQIRQRLALLGI